MITAEHLSDLPLFATFSEDERVDIARMAADVTVHAGEYLVHEGEEPYFFVVLTGTLSVTKRVGAREVVLATRERGAFFGESPVLLGATTFANFRADTIARVMRLDPFDLQALTARNAPFKATILRALADRVNGIGEAAVAKRTDVVAVVGHRWDSACSSIRSMLARNQIRHEFLLAGEPHTAALYPDLTDATTLYPFVLLLDGRRLTQPSDRELAIGLGLQTEPRLRAYDAVIVGGGPGGLAAAVYGASEGLSTLMIEREAPGGQAGTSSRIENYLGFPTGLSGDDLATRALEQARRLGADVLVTRNVDAIDAATKTVTLDGGETIAAATIILAMGVSWRELPIAGIDRYIGLGVYYGAARSEARNTTGKDVYIVGGGNSAGQAAMFFSNYARSVTVLVRGGGLAATMSDYLIKQLATKENICVQVRSEIVAFGGAGHLETIDIVDHASDERTTHATDAVFIFIGADAKTAWLPAAIRRDTNGFILTGTDVTAPDRGSWTLERDPFLLETSVPGIFAVGDVRHTSVKRVAAAVGEGSMSIAFAHQYLDAVRRSSAPTA